MSPTEPMLPWAPLEAYVVGIIDAPPAPPGTNGEWRNGYLTEDISTRLGVSVQVVNNFRHRGTISLYRADKLACHLGVNPTWIWGRDFLEIPDTCPHGHDRAEHGGFDTRGHRRCFKCVEERVQRRLAQQREDRRKVSA